MPTSRERLIADIALAVREFQEATDDVDEAAARVLGINRTDLRCLAVLSRSREVSAGQLGSEVGLSSGAMTAAIDRLARRGHAERVRGDSDRRRVTIRLTPSATELIARLWGPIGQESVRRLGSRDHAALEAILDFLREGIDLQAEHTARINDMAEGSASASPAESSR